jgi:Aerotolerance regulator N-terminal/von Willebrand factor type A domain
MSFLTPLYVLGLTAVIAPLVFHLIRRSPRGEVAFSSLMFLAPTPPRLTRRSRLDHLLLLLLRAAALCLLAFAFARPFLREAARLGFGEVERRRVALLIDTSASMRRGDLWPQALEQANKVVSECRPADQLAVFSFDVQTRPLLSFQESAERDPAQRNAIAKALLAKLAPSWGGTNLGQALIDVVGAVEDVADMSEKSGRMPRRVILISDLPQGSRLEALGDFEWPSDVDLELKSVTDSGSNAGLAVLAESALPDLADTSAGRRVRVFNDQSSRREKFELYWIDEHGKEAMAPSVEAYVPPGESRVVRVPRPKGAGLYRELRLRGDERGFDNAIYFADERREEKTVVYIGSDRADDPAGLLYYLERVFVDTPQRTVKIVSQLPGKAFQLEQSPSAVPLVILTAETNGSNARSLAQYVQGGGTLLFVATASGRAETLAAIAGVTPWDMAESTSSDVMLGEIKFDHPLFAPLAGAQFNDFTKIRFWKHRLIKPESLGDATVLARFETGDAAVIEKTEGKGRLVVFSSGWQRIDSQLARSSKFVALMTGLLEGRTPPTLGGALHLVYDRVPMPPIEPAAKPLSVHHPDGTIAAVPRSDASFSDTGAPGIYSVDTPDGSRSFAINLDPLESKTAALEDVTLEKLGCRLASHAPKPFNQAELRQMYNTELENRQKLWRTLVLATIGVLVVETWLAGRRAAGRRSVHAEAIVT